MWNSKFKNFIIIKNEERDEKKSISSVLQIFIKSKNWRRTKYSIGKKLKKLDWSWSLKEWENYLNQSKLKFCIAKVGEDVAGFYEYSKV